jgi:hypothetical protein
MGSAGIAARIAHVAFWGLLFYGWAWEEIDLRGIMVFLLLWVAGLYGLPYLLEYGAALFPPYVAVLDIALVFLIFKGDVRLT